VRTVETPPAGTKVPKRRFGRTEIQMPILTCGGCVLCCAVLCCAVLCGAVRCCAGAALQ
jgi:hypothetical protein